MSHSTDVERTSADKVFSNYVGGDFATVHQALEEFRPVIWTGENDHRSIGWPNVDTGQERGATYRYIAALGALILRAEQGGSQAESLWQHEAWRRSVGVQCAAPVLTGHLTSASIEDSGCGLVWFMASNVVNGPTGHEHHPLLQSVLPENYLARSDVLGDNLGRVKEELSAARRAGKSREAWLAEHSDTSLSRYDSLNYLGSEQLVLDNAVALSHALERDYNLLVSPDNYPVLAAFGYGIAAIKNNAAERMARNPKDRFAAGLLAKFATLASPYEETLPGIFGGLLKEARKYNLRICVPKVNQMQAPGLEVKEIPEDNSSFNLLFNDPPKGTMQERPNGNLTTSLKDINRAFQLLFDCRERQAAAQQATAAEQSRRHNVQREIVDYFMRNLLNEDYLYPNFRLFCIDFQNSRSGPSRYKRAITNVNSWQDIDRYIQTGKMFFDDEEVKSPRTSAIVAAAAALRDPQKMKDYIQNENNAKYIAGYVKHNIRVILDEKPSDEWFNKARKEIPDLRHEDVRPLPGARPGWLVLLAVDIANENQGALCVAPHVRKPSAARGGIYSRAQKNYNEAEEQRVIYQYPIEDVLTDYFKKEYGVDVKRSENPKRFRQYSEILVLEAHKYAEADSTTRELLDRHAKGVIGGIIGGIDPATLPESARRHYEAYLGRKQEVPSANPESVFRIPTRDELTQQVNRFSQRWR